MKASTDTDQVPENESFHRHWLRPGKCGEQTITWPGTAGLQVSLPFSSLCHSLTHTNTHTHTHTYTHIHTHTHTHTHTCQALQACRFHSPFLLCVSLSLSAPLSPLSLSLTHTHTHTHTLTLKEGKQTDRQKESHWPTPVEETWGVKRHPEEHCRPAGQQWRGVLTGGGPNPGPCRTALLRSSSGPRHAMPATHNSQNYMQQHTQVILYN